MNFSKQLFGGCPWQSFKRFEIAVNRQIATERECLMNNWQLVLDGFAVVIFIFLELKIINLVP